MLPGSSSLPLSRPLPSLLLLLLSLPPPQLRPPDPRYTRLAPGPTWRHLPDSRRCTPSSAAGCSQASLRLPTTTRLVRHRSSRAGCRAAASANRRRWLPLPGAAAACEPSSRAQWRCQSESAAAAARHSRQTHAERARVIGSRYRNTWATASSGRALKVAGSPSSSSEPSSAAPARRPQRSSNGTVGEQHAAASSCTAAPQRACRAELAPYLWRRRPAVAVASAARCSGGTGAAGRCAWLAAGHVPPRPSQLPGRRGSPRACSRQESRRCAWYVCRQAEHSRLVDC